MRPQNPPADAVSWEDPEDTSFFQGNKECANENSNINRELGGVHAL